MNTNSKKIQGTVPGRLQAVKVVDGDLNTALKLWKKSLKESNVVEELFDRKYFKKKSDVKRNQLSLAKYNQLKEVAND